jgi:3-methyladenine DNA glycosylase AlkD
MQFEQVMEELQSLGTEQNIKVYQKHSVQQPFYGVCFAHLKKLQKKIKINQPLADKLWESNVHDARMLACHIADKNNFTEKQANQWSKDLNNYIITDALAKFLATISFAKSLVNMWCTQQEEWQARCGWMILSHLALESEELENVFFTPWIVYAQNHIHVRANRIKDAMNNALIAIGSRHPDLEKSVITAAKSIGKVEVDHGDTNCKTPDIIDYLKRIKVHQNKKK